MQLCCWGRNVKLLTADPNRLHIPIYKQEGWKTIPPSKLKQVHHKEQKSLRGGEYHCFISYAAAIILGEHFKRSLLNFHSEVGNLDRCGFWAISPPRLIGCGIGLELKKSPCLDLRSLDCNKRNINSKFMRSTYKGKVRMLSIEKLMSIQTAKNYFIWKES